MIKFLPKTIAAAFKKIKNDRYWQILILIVSLSALARLLWLSQTMGFLYDQATHAQQAWQLVHYHEIQWLGPAFLDKGGFRAFLPPFYYWLIGPAIGLTFGNPLGAFVETALFGIAGVGLLALMGTSLFGRPTGLIAALLSGLNYRMIMIERQLWNPNFLPFFATAYWYLLWLVFTGKFNLLPLAFLILSIAISLHASVIIFIPITIFLFAWIRPAIKSWKIWALSAVGFIIPFLPWLKWEITNGWPNVKAINQVMFKVKNPEIFEGGIITKFDRGLSRFLSAFQDLILQHRLEQLVVGFLAVLIIVAFGLAWRSRQVKPNRWFYLLAIIGGFFLMTSQYRLPIWDYFWQSIWPIMFLVTAAVIVKLYSQRTHIIIIGLVLGYLTAQGYFWSKFVIARLDRQERQNLGVEDIVLGDMVNLVNWVAKDAGSQAFQVDFHQKYFYPGFADWNSYQYLFRTHNLYPNEDQKLQYIIVEPKNYPDDELGKKGNILAQKTFGALKVVKLLKK